MLLLPIAAFITTTFWLANRYPDTGWRRSALRAAALLATYALLATELLSVGSFIQRGPLAAVWALAALLPAGLLVVRVRRGHPVRWPTRPRKLSWVERGLSLGLLLILAITALVAWVAPPQTWDALNYHMPRVAQWAQSGSLRHFATGIEVQNSRTPGAEILMLHTYVLGDSDRWVNFVQWSAMTLSLAGASLVARKLGAGRRGQLASAIFAATLPMGIAQASSATTDYLVALWVVIAASEVLTMRHGKSEITNVGFAALTAGLGLATKPTSLAYLIPLAAYAGYLLLRGQRAAASIRWAALAAALVVVLNLGHVARNFGTYGSPVNPQQVAIHSNQSRGLGGVVSNLVRHAGLHLGTPSPHINKALAVGVQELHSILGVDVNDPRSTAHGVFKISEPTTNEDRTGNPLHAYLLVVLIGFGIWKRPTETHGLVAYGLILVGSMVLMSYLFKWQIFASRYHLAFFVLAAPIAGVLLDKLAWGRWLPFVSALMFLSALPWLLQIKSRPLLPDLGESYVGGILEEPRARLYLANGLNLIEPYTEMTSRILEARCKQVGLSLSGNAAEYPIWAFLGAPSPDLQVEWRVGGTPSAQYENAGFRPCAVVCESCPPDQEVWSGLPLRFEQGAFRLYLGEG